MSLQTEDPLMVNEDAVNPAAAGIAAGANTYGQNDSSAPDLSGLDASALSRLLTGSYGSYNNSSLPYVGDPNATYASITRQEYQDYVNNYRAFEEKLINQALTDTSLIDQAREDSLKAAEISSGIAQRNASRYGAALTPAQQKEMQRGLQLANTLGGVQAVNDSRIAQREANQRLLSDLINIGQGVNRSSQQGLASAAADASARKQAYDSAKAASRAQTYSTIGTLGAAAILAFV